MGHLCYVYIFKYRALENIELVVDPRCKYKSSVVDGKVDLQITTNDEYYDRLFGENVYSLTGIFGNNGCGKSSILYLLTQELGTEDNYNNFLGIFVFKDDKGVIKAFYQKEKAKVAFNGVDIEPEKSSDDFRFYTFYYCNHFIPYEDKIFYEPVKEPHTNRHYNAADGALLATDLEDKANKDTTKGNFPYKNHVKAFEIRNHYRICRLLADNDIRAKFKGFKLPRYMVLAAKDSSMSKTRLSQMGVLKEEEARIQIIGEKKLDIQYFLYFCLLDFFEKGLFSEDRYLTILTQWSLLHKKNNGYSNAIIHILHENYPDIRPFINVITRVIKFFTYDEDKCIYYIEIPNFDKKQIEIFDPVLRSNEMVTSWCFDLIYCQDLNNYQNTILSAGEDSYLKLFSRLYDAFLIQTQQKNIGKSQHIIFLDEAESEFHPTWQQEYIRTVLDFFNSFSESKDRFQIIITSHSPILLSDVPLSCSNYYQSNNENHIERVNVTNETFAANIFDLMRKSFFLDQGMVGFFAKDMIKKLIEDINHSKNDDDKSIINRINMIGDYKIKEYLMASYEKINSDEVIKYYQKRIAQLESQKK